MIRKLISWNLKLSRTCDRVFFEKFAMDGNGAFNLLAPELVKDGSRVADVGGGKTPFFPPEKARQRNLRVTGVDIDAAELNAAPAGAYAEVSVCAIEQCRGVGDQDIVIAQSVLEHVYDGREAMRGIGSMLRPGGMVVTFCPNRRAWFARLNLLLPERVKRAILFSIFPNKRERQGFPAHYDGCTPREMEENMRHAGIRLIDVRYFYVSSYFMFFVPLYLFWRLATYPLMRFWPHRYCETFIAVGIREARHDERQASS